MSLVKPPSRFGAPPPAPQDAGTNLNMESVVRAEQVSFGSYVPAEFRDRFQDICHRHRLRMREMFFAMTDFWEAHIKDHPEFPVRSYREDNKRKKI